MGATRLKVAQSMSVEHHFMDFNGLTFVFADEVIPELLKVKPLYAEQMRLSDAQQ